MVQMLKKTVLILALAGWSLSFASAHTLRSSIHPHQIARKLAFTHLFGDGGFFKGELKDLVDQEGALRLASHLTGALDASPLSEAQIDHIEKLTAHYPNKQLSGYSARSFEQLEQLDPEQVDISTAMAILEEHSDMRSSRAALDWMAYVIESHLPKEPSTSDYITAISEFIFFDLGIRFPPHSLYEENIDSYTFLSAVIGKRQGVCLGVSVLYLSIAQRLGLDLEIVTPPGHIYLRTTIDGAIRNIETTARGIDIPTEHYESISAPKLKIRTLKETVGLCSSTRPRPCGTAKTIKQRSSATSLPAGSCPATHSSMSSWGFAPT